MTITHTLLSIVSGYGAVLVAAALSSSTPANIAHRGASAYAPEHTRAAYELAIAQGADYVEQDLGVTRDGVLVCLHDDSLERTTNVEEVFPARFTTDPAGRRRWMLADFTLEEVKRLDAGSWFAPAFAGERILTWDEAVAVVDGRAGLYPELKSPALYAARGVDIVALAAAAFAGAPRAPLPGGRDRLIVQSFDADALRALAKQLPTVPRVLLVGPQAAERWLSPAGLDEVRRFASGIGPAKGILLARPSIVDLARQRGLTVTPYTFRSGATGDFPDVAAEMRHFLSALGVDALFTDNPDLFPRR
jgi:glycerophosphoryl diester phosphodiesterase